MAENSEELDSWISNATDRILELSQAKTLKDLAEYVIAEDLVGYKSFHTPMDSKEFPFNRYSG